MSSTGQDLAPADAAAPALSGLAAQLAGNAANTDVHSVGAVPDYTDTDLSPPEAFIPYSHSVSLTGSIRTFSKSSKTLSTVLVVQHRQCQGANAPEDC